MRRWMPLLLAPALLSGCETARKVDQAVVGTLKDAVEALDELTPEVDGSGRIVQRKAQTVHDFAVPDRCVQDGAMRTDTQECALLNQAMLDGCVYRPGRHDLWWITKPHCQSLFEQYEALDKPQDDAQEEKNS
ncbi:MAG TPA: hypothetical protein ENK62_07460 [Chromatiales bacterium]|nr:hypothetical protein [Chromatiales bacterium]